MTHAEKTVALLKEHGWHISFAESCTAGLAVGTLVDVPSASSVLDASFITYANEAKVRYAHVEEETLASHGAVSEETALEMAVGVAKETGAEVGVGISGIAGPGGGTPEKPVGTVWVAVKVADVVKCKNLQLCDAGRLQNIQNSTFEALHFIYEVLLGKE